MRTEYMVVTMKRGEIMHQELGPIDDLEIAEGILMQFGNGDYHLAYIATREVTEWEKI